MNDISQFENVSERYEWLRQLSVDVYVVRDRVSLTEYLCKIYPGDADIEEIEEALSATNFDRTTTLRDTIYEYCDDNEEPSNACLILTTPQNVQSFPDVFNRNTPAFVVRYVLSMMILTLARLESAGVTAMTVTLSDTFVNNANEVILTGNTDAVFEDGDRSVLSIRFGRFVRNMCKHCGIPLTPELKFLLRVCDRAPSMDELASLLELPEN